MHFSVERFTELKLNYTPCNNGHNNTLLSFNGESFWNKKYYVFPLGKIGHFSKVVVYWLAIRISIVLFLPDKDLSSSGPAVVVLFIFS